jgi:hypothetical protein
MSAEQRQWSDERFLRKACDQMAAEMDWDSLDSGRLHRATCAAKTLAGEPVIVGVLDHADILPAVLKDAEQERGNEQLPVGTPIWLYMPAGLPSPLLPPTVVVRLIGESPADPRLAPLREVHGDEVASVHLGPWEAYAGTELPGIAGKTWHRADAFVKLRGGAVLCVQPWRISLMVTLPSKAVAADLRDESGTGCVGRKIQDILNVDSETWLLVLDDGRYIANRFVPGGTSLHIGRFSEWEPDELAQPAKSFVTGQARDLRLFLVPGAEGP